MIFLITALLLLLNTQIVPTQAMELTPTPTPLVDQEAENSFKKDLYYLARINHIEKMMITLEAGVASKSIMQANNLADLKNLCLVAKNITNIPLDISRLARSSSVYLSTNQHGMRNYYTTLADNGDIDFQSLNLSNNHIESFGELVGCFMTLTSLYLAHNKLTSIHENITQLTKLKTLDLTGNNDLTISAELGKKLLALPKLDQQSKDGIKKYIKES